MQTHSKRWTWISATCAALLATPSPPAHAAAPGPLADLLLASVSDLHSLAALSLVGEPRLAATARERLRAAGPAGLTAFLARHRDALAAADLSSGTARSAAEIQLLETLDELCGQRDCAAARLYWYTDLEQARAAARASGKPIVSLRLLGDLRDELSCANSRFFRALLYPDPAVAALLRDRFVLHWLSERPAPKLTIDLGDGRSVTTTITGNSVHHVLDSEGRPIDALPGLMQPRAFVDGLERAAALATSLTGLDPAARELALRNHHRDRLAALERAWARELRAIGQSTGSVPQPLRLGTPRAGDAAPLAITKAAIEAPVLGGLGDAARPLSDDELYDRLAARHQLDVPLSTASLTLLRRQQWRSGDPQQDERDFQRALEDLRRTLVRDSLRNEFELHRTIHRWFVAAELPRELEAINRRIYDELFLTPRSDPWLGLAAPTLVSGLAGGGRRVQARL